MLKKFSGAWTALITPMNKDFSVDYNGLKKLIDYQIDGGIDGLVILGTTGETPTLVPKEKQKVMDTAIKHVSGRAPVIIGTGSYSTATAVQNTATAMAAGADGALVVTPYYNKPNASGLRMHYEAVANVGLPIIMYNVPGRTGRNISIEELSHLANIPNIIGVKEASGNTDQIAQAINQIAVPKGKEGKEFSVFSGDDALTEFTIRAGGDGVISVIANAVPAKVKEFTSELLAKGEPSNELRCELYNLARMAFIETNPVAIKAIMNYMRLPAGPTRLPLGPLSDKNETLVRKYISDYLTNMR